MTRQDKARYIIKAGIYIIHDCNINGEAPADDTAMYYLSNHEIDMIFSETIKAQNERS